MRLLVNSNPARIRPTSYPSSHHGRIRPHTICSSCGVIGTQITRLADERSPRGISAWDSFGEVVVTGLGQHWATDG
jgi:hypothetical protein